MKLRLPLALVLLVGGALVGTAATLVHGLGVGMALTLVATLTAVLALPPGWWSRLPFSLGWLLVVFYFSNPRPEGDYLVAGDTEGYVLLGLGMVTVFFSIVTLRPPAPRAGDDGRREVSDTTGDVGTVADPS
ncbi:hypothetical protein [Nocardioides sp.]|jgi:hypothetical protein|uniref:hypothetical protein n=1 Tax=Nocardioides sp. TaxID=35761 RepID=UPI00260E803D|nr:hypothetical protein [Nocardioides sp.]